MGRREGTFCDLKGYTECSNLAIDKCVLCERDACSYHMISGPGGSSTNANTAARGFRVLFQRLDYSSGSNQPNVNKEAALNIAICIDCRDSATAALNALASDVEVEIIKYLRAILSARALAVPLPK